MFGYTALMLASQQNQLEIVKYLVSIGADLKVKDHNGNTAAHFATGESAEYLLSIGMI